MAGWPCASNRLATRGATHRDWGVVREKRERRRGREGERGKGEGVARPGAAKRTLGCPLVLRTSELPCTLRAASRLSQSPRVTTVSSLASYPGLVVRPGPGADPLVLIAIVKERRVDLPDARHVGHTTEDGQNSRCSRGEVVRPSTVFLILGSAPTFAHWQRRREASTDPMDLH